MSRKRKHAADAAQEWYSGDRFRAQLDALTAQARRSVAGRTDTNDYEGCPRAAGRRPKGGEHR